MKQFVKLSVAALVVAVVFAAALPAAKAATATELEATIKALQAQIAALGSGSSAGSASADYTPFEVSLKMGSKGDEVTRLQQYLEETGDFTLPAGADYGYFGAATKKAVISYQKANDISPASGNFGPLTREAVNADLEAQAAAATTATGTSTPATGSTGSTVMAGDGSLTATVKSSPSSGQSLKKGETKDIMAVEFKATGGDVSVNRLKVKFDKRAWLYFGKVTLKDAAGTVIAEKALDSSMEEVTSGSDYRVSFEDFTPIVVKQGEKKVVTISVSALASTDKDATSVVMSLPSGSIRTVNGKGYTETISGDQTRTISFQSSSVGNLIVTLDANTPTAAPLKVTTNSESSEYTIASFAVKAENKDVTLKTLKTVVNVSDVDLLYQVNLVDPDGNTFAADVLPSTTGDNTLTFSDINYKIAQDARKTFAIKVKFKAQGTTPDYASGATVYAKIVANTTNVVGEDTAYDTATVNSGTATGNTMAALGKTPSIAVSSKDKGVAAGPDTAQYLTQSITFKVTAGDDDVYVLKGSALSGEYGVVGTAYEAGVAIAEGTEADVSRSYTSDATSKTNSYLVPAGSTKTFTWTSTITPKSGKSGQYQSVITGIKWATTDSATSEYTYNYNLSDFQTDSTYVAN